MRVRLERTDKPAARVRALQRREHRTDFPRVVTVVVDDGDTFPPLPFHFHPPPAPPVSRKRSKRLSPANMENIRQTQDQLRILLHVAARRLQRGEREIIHIEYRTLQPFRRVSAVCITQMSNDRASGRQQLQKLPECLLVLLDRAKRIEVVTIHIRHEDDVWREEVEGAAVLTGLKKEEITLPSMPVTSLELKQLGANDDGRIESRMHEHPCSHGNGGRFPMRAAHGNHAEIFGEFPESTEVRELPHTQIGSPLPLGSIFRNRLGVDEEIQILGKMRTVLLQEHCHPLTAQIFYERTPRPVTSHHGMPGRVLQRRVRAEADASDAAAVDFHEWWEY
ncbi:hypothetical protein A2424_02685 [Candidatus Peribacteria bacterium RIFOXYC1_FULL_54_13]|nr:MAG: hypothetical protein A2424_02685 [Candidatus Peribacteria bacterium RIFOXYC1_FULL_54_13]